jgi:predicted ATPase with chaperone activity
MPSRIFQLPVAAAELPPDAGIATEARERTSRRFVPKAPESAAEAGLSEAIVESLVFKSLLAHGSMTSRQIATQTALPGKSLVATLNLLKLQQLVFYRDQAALGDFEYGLTEAGRLRARLQVEECAYLGPAPVPLDAYIRSVTAQGITTVQPKRSDLERAFRDLLIDEHMFERLGPAINSGRGMFLYGYPGNGKSSIAERITDCFGDEVWIPHALLCAGEIVTLFDPEIHQRADADGEPSGERIDRRWVRIRRPTVVVGGELTMDALEMSHNHRTNVTEAALQLKSNTGTLVIDDFGRQRVSPIELLNRWIVPLEKRQDYLSLANGSKVRVPFDQLIIFSTNLEPKDLVDEAFLRRIPYKINVIDPTEAEFRKLFELVAPHLGVEIAPGAVDHLVASHYRAAGRPFRCCQPRDLLLQIRSRALFDDVPAVATPETFNHACENYFAVM